ncbi:DNA-3-methyladenine glycosylase 2 family protein [Candidatus Desantisbacteria bacterium]|nr:DNA-3-methyladenine glycosylase 2 family protein [Candidatus Desantisbacteria bacterium]
MKRAFLINNICVLCEIIQKNKHLKVSFLNSVPKEENIEIIKKQIQKICNTQTDIREFYKTIKKDNTLSKISSNFSGLKPPLAASLFEAMIIAITEQQLNISVAISQRTKLVKNFGEKVSFENKEYYSFPSFKHIADLSSGKIHKLGFSSKKAEYMILAAKLINENQINEEQLKCMDIENARCKLMSFHGIGPWTAEYILLRGLNRCDVSMLSDAGIKKAISFFYFKNKEPDIKELLELSNNWGKYKGYAAFYLLYAYQLNLSL